MNELRSTQFNSPVLGKMRGSTEVDRKHRARIQPLDAHDFSIV